jgi:hypothetical protein
MLFPVENPGITADHQTVIVKKLFMIDCYFKPWVDDHIFDTQTKYNYGYILIKLEV